MTDVAHTNGSRAINSANGGAYDAKPLLELYVKVGFSV